MTTIGVAIDVPDPWGADLQEYRQALGDVTASGIPTHITLVPPYEVPESAMPAVERHLGRAAERTAPYPVHLRGTGTFRPVSPVVFVTLVEGISRCEQLAAAIRRGPLACELNFPYHPHVTIAHHLTDATLDRAFEEMKDFEVAFDVTGFWLYVHDNATGWRPTREFRLAG